MSAKAFFEIAKNILEKIRTAFTGEDHKYNLPKYRRKCEDCKDVFAEITIVSAEAVVVSYGTEAIPNLEDCDSEFGLYYWYYEYEYCVPGTDEIRKHRDRIEFSGSCWGRWFEKYDKGFRFPVRYNKDDPTRHIRLHNFD